MRKGYGIGYGYGYENVYKNKIYFPNNAPKGYLLQKKSIADSRNTTI
jgi:hypothetical protein